MVGTQPSVRFKSYLDVATNLVIVAVLGYLGFAVYEMRRGTRPLSSSASQAINAPVLAGVLGDALRPGLVIAVSSDCKPCRDNMPYYLKLLSNSRASPRPRSIKFVMPSDDLGRDAWAKEFNLGSSDLVPMNFKLARVSRLPLAAKIDERGEISRSWMGPMSEAQFQRVEEETR